MTLLWLADWDECNSVALVWSGVAPAQIQMGAYAIVNAIIVLPFSRVDPRHMVQAALQEHAWTNDQVPDVLARRAAVAGGGGAALDDSEPVFVVERALMALWFSMLAYEDAGETLPGVPDKDVTLPIMMRLCGLDNMVAFHEHYTALHVIAAWSDTCIVVAFRGTAEPANFKADIQLCLKAKTLATDVSDAAASRPRTRWGDRPAAHAGFMHTWTHARINQRITSFIVARIKEQIARAGAPPHVLLCGHSLGGALATLAAMDLREACGASLPSSALTVFTFGSPRVGSAALARYYDAQVCPDHWAVVNQHDVVTHGGRLCGIYKHVGKRVLINPRGDMIVRPDFVEASFQHWIGAESLDDVRARCLLSLRCHCASWADPLAASARSTFCGGTATPFARCAASMAPRAFPEMARALSRPMCAC
jgi:pimeloyl-ACP methyl ester carboxylesterase